MTDTKRSPFEGLPILVTGATGIVGGWLVLRLLELGGHVIILLRDEPAGSELIRSGDIARVTRVRGDLENGRARIANAVDAMAHPHDPAVGGELR